MSIAIRSRKAKGKRLENWIAEQVKRAFPELTNDDLRVNIGAETGMDLKLSQRAMQVFPYGVEAKYQEATANLYAFYEQSRANSGSLEPLVIIKKNREIPLAIISADHFFELIKKEKNE